ncbi:MAG: hypothetical protein ABI969_19170 [bacterium]
MTAPFVTQLRARGAALQLAKAGEPAITVRVEMPEVWNTVNVIVSPTQRVVDVKIAALKALYPVECNHEDFVCKFRGWEVLDENETIDAAGASGGSIFLLTHRRRRAVR